MDLRGLRLKGEKTVFSLDMKIDKLPEGTTEPTAIGSKFETELNGVSGKVDSPIKWKDGYFSGICHASDI